MFMALDGRRKLPGMTLLCATGVVGSAFEVVGVGMVSPLIAILADPTLIDKPGVMREVSQYLAIASARDLAIVFGVALAALFILKAGFVAVFNYLQIRIATYWSRDLTDFLMRSYLDAPYVMHLRRNSAEFIRNLNLGMGHYSVFITGIAALFSDCVTIIGLIAVLVYAEPKSTLIAGAVMTCLLWIQQRIMHERFVRLGAVSAELSREHYQIAQQTLSGIKQTKVSGTENYFASEYRNVLQRMSDNNIRIQFINRLPPLLVEAIMMIGVVVVIVTILLTAGPQKDVIASFGLLAAAAFRLTPMFNRLMVGLNKLNGAQAGVEILVDEVVNLQPRVRTAGAAAMLPDAWSRIAFDNVSFIYDGNSAAAIHDISLSIRRNEFVGLVGPSGAGKTTLSDVLIGLLTPSSGHIRFDDVIIDDALEAWRKRVGYVPQDIYLLDDTLRRNVAMGIDSKFIDETLVWRALDRAQLGDVVRGMRDGLDTTLGERGVRLSGGQRQRIGIARALYHDPELIVFDEATSSLDVKTEEDVSSAIRAMKGERTIIVIAHRLSTLKNCDRLIYLRAGGVVDTGTFAELAQRNPDFAETIQLSINLEPA